MEMREKTGLPKVGLFACFSGGSNTGSLTGMAALEVIKRMGSETVGICSLPAILNEVPRQSAMIRRMEKLVVVDGCHNECARKLLAGKGIVPDVYLNLEESLHLTKQGPFSSLAFTDDEVARVADAIVAAVNRCLADLGSESKKSQIEK
jgi:uncharacterized metal-binding protein